MQSQPFTRLRKNLRLPSAVPTWPVGTRTTSFADGERASEAHDLLSTSYGNGGGRVETFDAWWSAVSSDPDYDPSLFFILTDEAERLVGVAHCWKNAYLKDLVVAESWRRKGLGQALLLHVFECFRLRGADRLDLKVLKDNPNGADRLYRRLGMEPVG